GGTSRIDKHSARREAISSRGFTTHRQMVGSAQVRPGRATYGSPAPVDEEQRHLFVAPHAVPRGEVDSRAVMVSLAGLCGAPRRAHYLPLAVLPRSYHGKLPKGVPAPMHQPSPIHGARVGLRSHLLVLTIVIAFVALLGPGNVGAAAIALPASLISHASA